jgi:membrane-associated phospholipid phosphatase
LGDTNAEPGRKTTLTRLALARAVSIVGHPVVLIVVAAMFTASAQGASLRQLQFVGGSSLTLGAIVLGFSWWQVRTGRWSHVDASARNERHVLHVFLAALCLASAVLLWIFTRRLSASVALALSGAIVLVALVLAKWVKVSLHVAFAAFATALLWPNTPAFVVGIAVTAAVMWSRLFLRRHVAADVLAGLLLGAAAGAAYHTWTV